MDEWCVSGTSLWPWCHLCQQCIILKHTGKENGFTTQMKSGAEKRYSWEVWDILAFLLVSKIYSADFCRTQVRVHCITAASQRLLTGENGIIFLRIVLIGGGSGVCIANLLQKLFTLFHLLHWENERELINCHLSEFSINYCLQLPPHQPLCSKTERKILGVFYIAACSEPQCIYYSSYGGTQVPT